MSDHLAPYDTEQNYRVAGTEDSEPEWRDMLNKLIKARVSGRGFNPFTPKLKNYTLLKRKCTREVARIGSVINLSSE